MTTIAIEPFDAIDGNTANQCRVVGIDASGVQPEFIVIATDVDGWTHLARAQFVQRTPDDDQAARDFYAARNTRKSELGL